MKLSMHMTIVSASGRALRRGVQARAATTTTPAVKQFDELAEKLKEINALGGISGLIQWDEQVMMPPGAAGSRAAQKSALAGVVYEKQTDAALGKLIDSLAERALKGNPDGFSAEQVAVVRDAQRDFKKATALSKELAQRIARLESDAYHAWAEARGESNFSKFAPFLEQWVEISHLKAKAIDPTKDAYDVLLDDFERGMSAKRLDEIFAAVQKDLVPLLKTVKAGTEPDSSALTGKWDVKLQAKMCEEVAKDLGFNLERGRLDVSVHPFTGGAHPTDVRMTTRYKEHDLSEGLSGLVHETGHAIYEQGRNLAFDGLPVNQALSMGVHESQSLLWERMVGLSMPFCNYLVPKFSTYFPEESKALTPERIYAALNGLKNPPLIRVEADELQYPLHVILRYEIERKLVGGSLNVKDVPEMWNSKMETMLGCRPPNDAQGCLQDVHWSAGVFGYFPTYLLGAMMATQIFEAAAVNLPNLDAQIQKGEFRPLRSWLNKNIHEKGSLYPSADELMTVATGRPLDPQVFIKHLSGKYKALYKC